MTQHHIDLALLDHAVQLPALLEQDVAAARDFAAAEKAEGTRRAYRGDWRTFQAYCASRGLVDLPAGPDTVCAFLAAEAQGGAKASTLGRRVAAIRYAHKLAGHEPPTNVEAVKAVMRGIRRTIGAAPARKAAATAGLIRAMLDACPATMKGRRDRALLALGFAIAARRSELVALQVADLIEVPDGYRVRIARSKTDQEGQGAEVAVPRGSRLRPVEAVQQWLAAARITSGPVFRQVKKGGRLGGPLSGAAVREIVIAYARRVGLDAGGYSAHSLRAGFLTSAAESGASVFKMQAVSRHRSMDVLSGYIRSADAFRDHAGASFL